MPGQRHTTGGKRKRSDQKGTVTLEERHGRKTIGGSIGENGGLETGRPGELSKQTWRSLIQAGIFFSARQTGGGRGRIPDRRRVCAGLNTATATGTSVFYLNAQAMAFHWQDCQEKARQNGPESAHYFFLSVFSSFFRYLAGSFLKSFWHGLQQSLISCPSCVKT